MSRDGTLPKSMVIVRCCMVFLICSRQIWPNVEEATRESRRRSETAQAATRAAGGGPAVGKRQRHDQLASERVRASSIRKRVQFASVFAVERVRGVSGLFLRNLTMKEDDVILTFSYSYSAAGSPYVAGNGNGTNGTAGTPGNGYVPYQAVSPASSYPSSQQTTPGAIASYTGVVYPSTTPELRIKTDHLDDPMNGIPSLGK